VVETPGIDGSGDFRLARDNASRYIVNHNKTMLMALRSNHDLRCLISSGKHSYLAAQYVCKYASKASEAAVSTVVVAAVDSFARRKQRAAQRNDDQQRFAFGAVLAISGRMSSMQEVSGVAAAWTVMFRVCLAIIDVCCFD
jgi:hypothetical protein